MSRHRGRISAGAAPGRDRLLRVRHRAYEAGSNNRVIAAYYQDLFAIETSGSVRRYMEGRLQFKRDARTGEIKLIEAGPRPGQSHILATRCGWTGR